MQTVVKNPVEGAGMKASTLASHEEIATLAKALAHPARIQIIRLLMEKKSCIGCDVVDEVGLAQSTVSEHLRILKSVGIIIGEIERPRVCYSLNADRLQPLAGLLNLVFDSGNQGGCTTPTCWVSPNTKSENQ